MSAAEMIRFDAWRLPAGETHLQQWMTATDRREDGRLTYQFHKYEAALRACRERRRTRVAVDIGAHVGLWSFWMARDFEQLEAFEPKPEHRECWQANLRERANVRLFSFALGAEPARVALETGASSSGDTRVVLGAADASIEMRTLDSFALPVVDFIKLDCEGFELFVLRGAEQTLRRCRPVVMIEQKDGHGAGFGVGDHDGLRFLEALGARQVWTQAGDFLMVFPPEAL